MKLRWEPILAMVMLLALGAWIAYRPSVTHDLRPGAQLQKFSFASAKGELEMVREPNGEYSSRLLWRDGTASGVLRRDEFERVFGAQRYRAAASAAGNRLFRALNITSWGALAWVALGLLGQATFSARFLVQWLVSEKERQSVIPEAFWWLSLAGGVLLFTYFAWRQDLVGVLGQTSGLVIYARNIRLIWKARRANAPKTLSPE